MPPFNLRTAALAFLLLTVGSAWGLDEEGYQHQHDSNAVAYSFEAFVEEYGKVYDSEEERQLRKEIFDANRLMIDNHNKNRKDGGHLLKVNEFADRRIPSELPLGLQKKSLTLEEDPFSNLMMMRTTKRQSTDAAEEFYQDWLANQVVPVSDLPKEVDWRTHNPPIVSEVKNQGFCGSCWAVASTEVLESHIALKTGKLYKLSPQELVSCVANPEHCGGSGGCSGATYELAFDYVKDHGMVLDKEFPYKARDGKCTLRNATGDAMESLLRGTTHLDEADDSHYFEDAVATIEGYVNFPTNNYTVLLNAVATLGPIGVTVAAASWSFYTSGVYEEKSHSSKSATGVDHAVVLEGYGIDQETQEPFWLVRNSWGTMWGEGGYIRLKRVDPSTLDDFDKEDCGIDKDTASGAGCTKDKNGNDIVPKPVKVCGTSAILYDTFVPVGGKLIPTSRSRTNEVVVE